MVRHHKLIVGVIGLALGVIALCYGIIQTSPSEPAVGGFLCLVGIFMVVDAIFDLRAYARNREGSSYEQ